MTFWSFILNAGFVVKIVLFLLLFASIMSWTIIFQRSRLFKQSHNEARDFEDLFWTNNDIHRMFAELNYRREEIFGLSRIFHQGYEEFLRLKKQGNVHHTIIMQNTERAMRIAEMQELEILEEQLPFLAIVGSSSPFIGLLGTVWGIMTSFQALGSVQQATIAMVAPGISEALITTAIGLITAIPSAIAYNRFNAAYDRIAQQYQIFQESFINILQRKLHASQKTAEGSVREVSMRQGPDRDMVDDRNERPFVEEPPMEKDPLFF